MTIFNEIEYESTFGDVPFKALSDQSGEYPTDFATEDIVGGAVTGTSYRYVDWYVNPPDQLNLTMLLPDRERLEALAALRAYPVDNAGVPYPLRTAQFDWTATLDKLTWSGAYMDGPIKATGTFTKISGGLVVPVVPAVPVPVAGYIAGVSGLDVDLDLNQNTTAADDLIYSYNVEWGDTNTSTVTGGPWSISAMAIPIASHTYAAPSPTGADYVVTVSVVGTGGLSLDFSTVVTV